MKSCSEFQKGGIYFLMELDLALLLISVFTVTSCDMCLSVVFIFEVSMLCFWKKIWKFCKIECLSFESQTLWRIKFKPRQNLESGFLWKTSTVVCPWVGQGDFLNIEISDLTEEIPNSVYPFSSVLSQLFKLTNENNLNWSNRKDLYGLVSKILWKSWKTGQLIMLDSFQ